MTHNPNDPNDWPRHRIVAEVERLRKANGSYNDPKFVIETLSKACEGYELHISVLQKQLKDLFAPPLFQRCQKCGRRMWRNTECVHCYECYESIACNEAEGEFPKTCKPCAVDGEWPHCPECGRHLSQSTTDDACKRCEV